jgi:GxxExxY protein
MPDKRIPMSSDQLTYRIIGCAMAVHRERGPGYREDTYQRELEVKFTESDLPFRSEQLLEVFDADHATVLVGYYVPDFIVADQVVVEIKALSGLDNSHLAQAIGYLAVTGCRVALLVNFGARSLQWRRVVTPKTIAAHRANRQWLFVPDWLKQD